MTVGPAAASNPVVMKPAANTPMIAALFNDVVDGRLKVTYFALLNNN